MCTALVLGYQGATWPCSWKRSTSERSARNPAALASDGVAVARRGLKSVRGRVVLPDRDDNAVTATAPEQVSFEPLVGTEHRQRLLRGEALVLFGLCLIHLGPPNPHDHCLTLQSRLGQVNPGSRRVLARSRRFGCDHSVAGIHGQQLVSMTRASKKARPCLAAVDR